MINEALQQWDSLWRYPDLVTLIADQQPRGQVESHKAVRALLRGIATPSSIPQESLDQLSGAGEFKAAEDLLINLTSAEVISSEELKEMTRQLAEARWRGLDEIQVRLFELETRLLRLGVKAIYPPDLDEANSKLESARDSLTLFEYDIQALEETKQQELRQRLAAALQKQQPSTNRDAFEQAVIRCIDRCNFHTAESLLTAGRLVDEVSDPAMVPQRPIWPYVDGAHNGLRRFLHRGDLAGEFAREWGLGREDTAARELLFALEPLASVNTETLASDIAQFVRCLDTFLGAEEREHYVRPWENGYSSILFSINEQRVPRLAMCQGEVPIWFPGKVDAEIPGDLLKKSALVVFHPDSELSRENVLSFTASLLFRIVGDPNRRTNFIRWLARQIAPAEAMPMTFDLADFDEFQHEGTRNYASWFLEYHAIALESDSVLDLINFYSAKNPLLLCALLREICNQLPADGVINSKNIRAAWNGTRFQETATYRLLGNVQNDPWLLAVLACVYLVADEGEEVSVTTVKDWLQTYEGSGDRDVPGALRVLVEHSLLARGDPGDSIWIPFSPSVRLIRKKMGDLDQYVRKMLLK